VKILIDASAQHEDADAPKRFWQAIRYIIVGRPDDVHRQHPGDRGRLERGRPAHHIRAGVEHPVVVFSSNLLSRLMDRFQP